MADIGVWSGHEVKYHTMNVFFVGPNFRVIIGQVNSYTEAKEFARHFDIELERDHSYLVLDNEGVLSESPA